MNDVFPIGQTHLNFIENKGFINICNNLAIKKDCFLVVFKQKNLFFFTLTVKTLLKALVLFSFEHTLLTNNLDAFALATKFSANAGVKKRNFLESVSVAAIGKATVERFRIDVQADGALIEFRKIKNLVNRLFKLDFGGETIG